MRTKKDYIMLNDRIRQRIKELRKSKGIQSIHFSTQIMGKSKAYLSTIEQGVTKKIERENLEKIFENMLNISGEELDKYIADLVDGEPEIHSEASIKFNSETDQQADPDIVYYDENNKTFTEIGFNKIVDNIALGFNKVFEKDPKYAFRSLGELMNNLRFDMIFMLGLNSIPFYLLDKVDRDTKQQLFDEIGDVVKKYLDKHAASTDSDKEAVE